MNTVHARAHPHDANITNAVPVTIPLIRRIAFVLFLVAATPAQYVRVDRSICHCSVLTP
jgi:hypothetical protein